MTSSSFPLCVLAKHAASLDGNPVMRPGMRMMRAIVCAFLALAHPVLAEETSPPTEAVSPASEEEGFDDGLTYDPWERMNRGTHAFNKWFDRWIFKPVAIGYAWVLPDPVQNAVSRAFLNLTGPTVILNDLLQGKWRQSGADTTRFAINTTVGLVGFFDVATKWGFPAHDEDFGQTLGVWGVGSGPYLVLPIIGPRNLRDTGGLGMDIVTDVNTYVRDDALRYGLYALRLVNLRARLLGATDVVTEATGDDSYIFVRESYTSLRRNLIYDGNPPAQKFFDEETFDEAPVEADSKPAESNNKP